MPVWVFIGSLRGRSMTECIQALQHPLRWLNEEAHFVKTCHTVLVLEDGENSHGEEEPNFSLSQVSCLFSASRWTQHRCHCILAPKITVEWLCGALWHRFSIPWEEVVDFLCNQCVSGKGPSWGQEAREKRKPVSEIQEQRCEKNLMVFSEWCWFGLVLERELPCASSLWY